MRKKLLVLVLLLSAAVGTVGRGWAQVADGLAQAPLFTTASLNGTCGFSLTATNVNRSAGGPKAEVGTLHFNGSGSVMMSAKLNNHGQITTIGPVTGTYSVGPGGRIGSMDFTAARGERFTFVITSNGLAVRFIRTGPVNPTTGINDTVDIGLCKF